MDRSRHGLARAEHAFEVDFLVRDGMPLVHFMARRFVRDAGTREDLVSEGIVGLIEAAHRFDEARGHAFGTYARWWIRYRMQHYLAGAGRVVALPQTRTSRKAQRASRRARAELENRLGRPATLSEVAEDLGVTPREVLAVESSRASSERPMAGESSSRGVVLQATTDSPEELAAAHEYAEQLKIQVNAALALLSARERKIITEHYLKTPVRSLQELAEQFGVSRERVRQLKERALEKIRSSIPAPH